MPLVRLIVNGLGLGNSTRCHAIIQHLHARGARVRVATSGNGLWYFRQQSEVEQLDALEPLNYGAKDGRINITRTIEAVPAYLATIRSNARTIDSLIRSEKPDVIVIDSDYALRSARKYGLPLVAINNSDVVVSSYRMFSPPRSVRAQFYSVEYFDYLFHRTFPDRVISPTFDPAIPQRHPKFSRVAPLVRREIRADPWSGTVERVVVMLSGSVFGSPVTFARDDYPFRIDVIGRGAPAGGAGSSKVTYHSKVIDTAELLRAADIVVINGGNSAVGEAFVMRKPMVVVPVPGHAEQWVNARTIEHLGVGMMASEEVMEDAMLKAARHPDVFRAAYGKLGPVPSGAEQAADLILSSVRRV